MKKIKITLHSHIISTLCIYSLLCTQVFAEATPPGGQATYTNDAGSWTLYDIHGNVLPPGSKTAGSYVYKEDAANAKKRLEEYCSSNPTQVGPSDCDLLNNTGVAGVQEIHNAFDGEVIINNSFDPLKDAKPVATGPFSAGYNGIMQGDLKDSESKPVLNDEQYLAKSMEMTSFLWGISEVGEKLCKPVGKKHPGSLVGWWLVIKNYIAAEKTRDALVKKRIEILRTKMEALISDKSTNANLQLKAIEYQIESLNISIDSLSGSTLFGLDSEGKTSRATSRIPWRQALLEAAAKATEANVEENKANVKVYGACKEGTVASAAVAAEACKRTKKVKECTTSDTENSGAGNTPTETCIEKELPDPVPGSCEMAKSYIPLLQKGALKDMATLYMIVPIPSKQINERLIRIGDYINKSVAMYPVSDDPKFDWTKPLEACKEDPMMVTIKNNGIICPGSAKDDSYDKKLVDGLGSTNDPIMQMGKYALGVELNQVEYEYAKRMYDDNKAKGMDDFQNERALNAWVVTTGRGQAYINDGTYDKVADAAYHEQLSKDYKVPVAPCTAATCSSYPGEKTPEPNYNLPDASKVSDSAKSFLSTMGITGDQLDEVTEKFKENWNTTDLYLGQPVDRELYFKYVTGVVTDMIQADFAKLETMLVSRARLLKLYEDTKNMYQPQNKPGSPSQNGGGGAGPSLAGGVAGSNRLSVGASAVSVTGPVQSDEAASTKPGNKKSAGNSANTTTAQDQQVSAAVATGSSAGSQRYTVPGSSNSSSRNANVNAPRGSEFGRTNAVSPVMKRIAETKKRIAKSKAGSKSMAVAAGTPVVNEDKVVAGIAKSMGSTMDEKFASKHSSLFDAFDGGSELKNSPGAMRTTTTTIRGSNGSSYNRNSYSYGSNGSSRSSSSSSTFAKNKTSASVQDLSNRSMNGTPVVDDGVYRPVSKPAIFDQISKRYNTSGRRSLGLEEVKEEN